MIYFNDDVRDLSRITKIFKKEEILIRVGSFESSNVCSVRGRWQKFSYKLEGGRGIRMLEADYFWNSKKNIERNSRLRGRSKIAR